METKTDAVYLQIIRRNVDRTGHYWKAAFGHIDVLSRPSNRAIAVVLQIVVEAPARCKSIVRSDLHLAVAIDHFQLQKRKISLAQNQSLYLWRIKRVSITTKLS